MVTKAMVAALCLTCLSERKEEMASIVVDEEGVAVRRYLALERESKYRPYLASLDTFGKYVLDKLESVLHPTHVLDTQYYADTPEIESFLRHFHVSLLRVRPASEWSLRPWDIGSFQGRDPEDEPRTIGDEGELRALLENGHADLQVVHYQYEGFEHFDVLRLASASVGFTEEKKNDIIAAIHALPLVSALLAENVPEFRRIALELQAAVQARARKHGRSAPRRRRRNR